MKEQDKKEILRLVLMLHEAQQKAFELMDRGALPQYYVDICGIDEIVNKLENFLKD